MEKNTRFLEKIRPVNWPLNLPVKDREVSSPVSRTILYNSAKLQTKDYYTILELPPSANHAEIKTAYRRLAHLYHPDKNGNDPYAAAQFEIIKEAYEILINPTRKAQYLQQRWYDQSTGRKVAGSALTPVSVLKQVLELDRYVARLDEHRMDKQGLYDYICQVVSDETIEKLNIFNETEINNTIITSVLKISQNLPLKYFEPVSTRLLKINSTGSTVLSIHKCFRHSRRTDKWNKLRPWLVTVVVIILCFLIYLLGRQGYLP